MGRRVLITGFWRCLLIRGASSSSSLIVRSTEAGSRDGTTLGVAADLGVPAGLGVEEGFGEAAGLGLGVAAG